MALDWAAFPTPCYVIDEALLRRNLAVLGRVRAEAECSILLALKAFATTACAPTIMAALDGTTASGLHEARLGHEAFGGETHVCCPAYRAEEMAELLRYADHVVFNSHGQLARFGGVARAAGATVGLRINPEVSVAPRAIYSPCGPGSRFGVTASAFDPDALEGVSGLHLHALCEESAASLATVLAAVEERFGAVLPRMEWLNLGGGHHITRFDYDLDHLIALVRGLRARYGLRVYLEPGEAVALHAGYLVASVLDIVRNGMEIAILDTSATCHMPDVLEMPYRPEILGAGAPEEKPYAYRLGGPSCLAGDVIGDYTFDQPLAIGDRLVFTDMAHYTIVKTNTFNGVGLPSIVLADGESGAWRTVAAFGYDEVRRRLG